MPVSRHLYIPPLSAWKWPGRDVGSSPVTGQPDQLAPPPGPSAPTTGFPDTVDRPSTVLLPQFQAVVPGTRPSSPPTPVVSAASMPRLSRVSASWRRGPPSDGLHTSACRSEAPSTCPVRASLFPPPPSLFPCHHLPLEFQEGRTLLGFRPRGDWRHSCIYRRRPVSRRHRQWPGPVLTRC